MTTLENQEISKTMKLFLIVGLYLYKAKGLAQFLLIFITASATIPFIETLKKYIFADTWDNWVVFLILLTLDTGSGIYKHSGLWKCKQGHTTQADYKPKDTPALWEMIPFPGEYFKYNPMTLYSEGDIVWFPEVGDTLYRSKIDNNSWSPTGYPQGWEVYNP